MKKLILFILIIAYAIPAIAQMEVAGQVTEKENGKPLFGVTVQVQGTTKGTSTDLKGRYSLNNVADDAVLEFSYIGFETLRIPVSGPDSINVMLAPNVQQLEEVVVTALNNERNRESLGYSISQLSSDDIDVARENNVMNSLNGKVAGLQITQSNTGVDGSSRVLLRGITTISGNNRPLVVVDGIPINNGAGGAGGFGGIDRGDALSDINPDDVASISVLKGAGASAAYGSLGMNGVILITTKTGSKRKGVGISVNSSYNVTDIALTPDFQNEYGAGFFNDFAPISNDGRPVLDYPFSWSWGPKMEGQSYTNWLGESDTYSPQGNPYEAFYQKGYSLANTISFEGGSDKSAFRVSLTDEDVQGIIPNNTLSRQTISLRGNSSLTDNFSIDGKLTYLNSNVNNRPQLAEGGGNTSLQLALMPRDIRLEDVKNNTINAEGEEIKWNLDNTFNNPYWALNNLGNTDEKDRYQGFIAMDWDIGGHFNITGQSGMDYIVYDWINHAARGAQAESNGLGNYNHENGKSRIWNSDILATYTNRFGAFGMTTSLGASYRDEYSNYKRINGFDSKVRDFYNISNYKNSFSNESISKKGIASYYALAQLRLGYYLYLDGTIRNDHSSALPRDNNSYWYHSENISFLFARAFGLNEKIFSTGKLRGSYARVGNDTGPYRTQAVYYVDQTVTLPYTVASIPGSLPNFDLKPETSISWELGADLGFLNDRILLDFTFYKTNTRDQIQAVPISGSTGFSTKVVNAGNIVNKGVEVQLNTFPVDSDDFTWSIGANITKSNSTVESLNEGLESIELNRLWSVSVEARPGEEFGSIYGNDFLRDNFGRKLITNDGLAQRGERVKLGSINPDWYGGAHTMLRYKDLSLNVLVTAQQGGEFYSYGRAYRMFFGTDARTLPGRETGIIEEGINEHTGFVNEAVIPGYLKHFTDIFSNEVARDQILDASNVKLREVTLSYSLPRNILEGTFIQSATLSAVGRNLFFLYNAAGDIDPEAGYSSGTTATALEHSSLPSTRTYGVNLKLNF